jgi:CheY-like chemotaxis protein
LELLELSFPDDENVKNSADGIRQAIKQATGLTRQIMAYAGKNELMAKPIDLNRLLDDLLPVVQTTLAQNASIEIKFAHDLRPIMGDANLLRQMAMNLLTNASDALTGKIGKITLATYWMKANEADLTVALSEAPVKPGTYAVLEVSDSGTGMDADTRSRIFDPFFSTKGGGRGLGLSAVWGIVKAHSGAICVRSTVGVGSSFQVLLPLNDERQNKNNQTTKTDRTAQTDAILPLNGENKRGTILLVEDETEIRNQIARQLETSGFNVLQAADGKQAVSAFQQNGDDISLILLDVEMPEMNGEEALRIIRRESATVKAVVMSGYGLARVRDSFTHLEIAGMLAKPFTRAQLLSVLEEALRS